MRNSDFFNKVDVNFNQSPLFVGDFSEKSNGNPGPSSSVAMSPTDGQLPTDPAQLKVVRRQRKGGITRHLGTLEQLMAEERYDDVLKRLDIMKQSFSQLEAAHDAYLDTFESITEEQLLENEQWFAEVQGNYISGVKAARQWLRDNGVLGVPLVNPVPASVPSVPTSVPSVPTSVPASANVDNSELVNMMNVPKLTIDVFDGNPLQYQKFMSIFDETVGDKVSDDRAKLTRLLQYTTGPAKAAIENCALIPGSAGYKQARDILQTRFGNDHLISRKLASELTSGKSVSKASDLRQLADDLSMAYSVLESLSTAHEIDNQNTILEILQRCPKYIQTKWQNKALNQKQENDSYPNFGEFVKFMSKMAINWCDPVYGGEALKAFKSRLKSSSVNSFSADSSASVSPKPQRAVPQDCVSCGQKHRLIYCDTFKAMTPSARFRLVKDKRLCFNCLLPNHMVSRCKSQSVCTVPGCGKRHSKFIHIDTPVTPATSSTSSDNITVGGASSNPLAENARSASTSAFGNSIYLPIVPVCVNGNKVFALLDTGSTNTFVTEGLAKRLELSGSQHEYVMRTVSGVKSMSSKVVTIKIAAVDGSYSEVVSNVLVESSIPARYPSDEIDICKYPHLTDVPIAPVCRDSPVEVLIGMDNSHLIAPLEVRRNPRCMKDPYATKTVLGWALNGHAGGNDLYDVSSSFVQLDQCVERLWQMESNDLNDDKSYSVEDREVISLWDREIRRENGHYVLPIPWRNGTANLPDNKFMAKHRLDSLNKRLAKTGLTEIYDSNLKTMVEKGYAERVPDDELKINDGTVWYIPHHPVFSKPGKVRPVFDCSAQCHGTSLNRECMQGPNLTNNLMDVLLRFRQFNYAIIADIESMYLQVRVPDADRNALRFLWYDDDDSIVEFRMTSHLFGGIWCAASSAYALRHTVTDMNPNSLIRDTILKSFYVDDMLKSVRNFSEACDVIHETKRVLRHGGFNLTKFMVNDNALLEQVDIENRAKDVKEIVPDIYCKALGIQWEVSGDTFHYKYKCNDQPSCVNRRHMLSCVSSMYDPLGLIGPVVLQGKTLFQEATRLRLTWDDPVPPSLLTKWVTWQESLQGLDKLKFDRCVVPPDFIDGVYEIHHFCDASLTGYGACSYLRIINHNGLVHVALLVSKARLAPIKQQTVPRLELSAAVLAVKLDQRIRKQLELPILTSQFWSDSQIVIAYIRNQSKRFKTFVANRVAQIRQFSEPNQWHYVSGDKNPADVLSRGCTSDKVPLSWFRGPDFLCDYKCNWPACSLELTVPTGDPEVCKSPSRENVAHAVTLDDVTVTSDHPFDALIRHYSSYYRLQKAISWLTRFVRYLSHKHVETGPISCSEMNDADTKILRFVQSREFADEIRDLKLNGKVRGSSRLIKLCPVLCPVTDLIVIDSRLQHAPLSPRAKSPVILPSGNKISRMLVTEYHGYAHLGTEWVLSRLRSRYWIIKARSLIKRVRHACVTCRRLYGGPMMQRMANLPPERCQPDCAPFSYVGVDLFGPFLRYCWTGASQTLRLHIFML